MTVWRISGGESGPGFDAPRPRPERPSPRHDTVEIETPLLRAHGGTGSPWLRLTGEIDMSNTPEVARALAVVAERVPGDVHADLAGVDFIDVAGLRAIVKAGQGLWREGRLLILHSVSPHVDKLVRLIGWDAAPGLLVHCGVRPPRTE